MSPQTFAFHGVGDDCQISDLDDRCEALLSATKTKRLAFGAWLRATRPPHSGCPKRPSMRHRASPKKPFIFAAAFSSERSLRQSIKHRSFPEAVVRDRILV